MTPTIGGTARYPTNAVPYQATATIARQPPNGPNPPNTACQTAVGATFTQCIHHPNGAVSTAQNTYWSTHKCTTTHPANTFGHPPGLPPGLPAARSTPQMRLTAPSAVGGGGASIMRSNVSMFSGVSGASNRSIAPSESASQVGSRSRRTIDQQERRANASVRGSTVASTVRR